MINLIESIDEFFRRQMVCQNGPKCDSPFCPQHHPNFNSNEPETWPVTEEGRVEVTKRCDEHE